MNFMLYFALRFDQDLGGWCSASLGTGTPTSLADGSPINGDTNKVPTFGDTRANCPVQR